MNRNYSDWPLFVWLRKSVFKINKPFALPWGEWDTWRDQTRKEHPFGWFMTETLPDILELPAKYTVDPINDLRYYVRMRWGLKSHLLRTELKPGVYHDSGEKLLHGCFTELVEFVEMDCASHNIRCGPDSNKSKYNVPWYERFWLFRWGAWRNASAGIDYLRWESTLDHPDLDPFEASPDQAEFAREKLALYFWWTQTRPNRTDPHDASGWNKLDEEARNNGWDIFGDDLPKDYKKRMSAAMDLAHDIEHDYENEDQDMLIRLIKIRKSLWT
jgi:hypothetical protein